MLRSKGGSAASGTASPGFKGPIVLANRSKDNSVYGIAKRSSNEVIHLSGGTPDHAGHYLPKGEIGIELLGINENPDRSRYGAQKIAQIGGRDERLRPNPIVQVLPFGGEPGVPQGALASDLTSE